MVPPNDSDDLDESLPFPVREARRRAAELKDRAASVPEALDAASRMLASVTDEQRQLHRELEDAKRELAELKTLAAQQAERATMRCLTYPYAEVSYRGVRGPRLALGRVGLLYEAQVAYVVDPVMVEGASLDEAWEHAPPVVIPMSRVGQIEGLTRKQYEHRVAEIVRSGNDVSPRNQSVARDVRELDERAKHTHPKK